MNIRNAIAMKPLGEQRLLLADVHTQHIQMEHLLDPDLFTGIFCGQGGCDGVFSRRNFSLVALVVTRDMIF